MHPAIISWKEAQRSFRISKIYDGLKIKNSRPRYVFLGKDQDYYSRFQPQRKTIALFPPLSGNRRNGIIIPGLRSQYRPIMGGSSATYYVRADGTATSKEAATGPGSSQSACMNAVYFNSESSEFLGDDIVKFCDNGGVFRAELYPQAGGSQGHQLIFEAEDGDNPKIYGSELASGWTDQGSNKWRCSIGATEPSAVWFSKSSITYHGNKETSTDGLDNEYDWYHDGSQYLWCYSTGDPDSVYDWIEAGQRHNCLWWGSGINYITVDGIEFVFGDWYGIQARPCTGAQFLNLIIHHCGHRGVSEAHGLLLAGTVDALVRDSLFYENGTHGIYIGNYGATSNIGTIIESNIFHDNYHTCVDFQRSNADGVVSNNIVRYNYFYDINNHPSGLKDGAVYAEAYSADRKLDGLDVYYNIAFKMSSNGFGNHDYCINVRYCNNVVYGANEDAESYICGFAITANVGGTSGITLKNNIGMDCPSYSLAITDSDDVDACDYNCWYKTSGNYVDVADKGSTPYSSSEFETYKSETGWDEHGKWENPDFMDAPNEDFRLKTESPCIETGTEIAGLIKDYYGIPLGRGIKSDIGACETLKGGPRRL